MNGGHLEYYLGESFRNSVSYKRKDCFNHRRNKPKKKVCVKKKQIKKKLKEQGKLVGLHIKLISTMSR